MIFAPRVNGYSYSYSCARVRFSSRRARGVPCVTAYMGTVPRVHVLNGASAVGPPEDEELDVRLVEKLQHPIAHVRRALRGLLRADQVHPRAGLARARGTP